MSGTNISNSSEMFIKSIDGFILLSVIYAGILVMAGLHGAKLVDIGGLTFDAGLITFSLTFVITDIISEVYGKKYARKLVTCAFLAIVVAFITTQFSLILPASSHWEISTAYETIMGSGSRIFIAALVTYVLSQFTDITVFSFIKSKTGEKHLWLRNNLSTLVGGFVDAVVFSTIAFYGVYDLAPIIISAYVARILISLVDTPFVYLGVYILRKMYPELKSVNV